MALLRRTLRSCPWSVIFSALFMVYFCEYFLYRFVLSKCTWPTISPDSHLKVMVLADPHLVGPYRGSYLDQVRRDWQMKQAFQASLSLHAPDVAVILGDIFDEGQWLDPEQFQIHMDRYYRIFAHDESRVVVKNLVGNHDVGFHYVMNEYLLARFDNSLSPTANGLLRLWVHKGIPFVFINSMAFEGDQCHFCAAAERTLGQIVERLRCSSSHPPSSCSSLNLSKRAPYMDSDSEVSPLVPDVKPIVLQHFPLYRVTDHGCPSKPPDAMPPKERDKPYRPKWDCLSQDATNKLLTKLKPRLVLSGHSHYSCRLTHPVGNVTGYYVPEWTVASFSWRNLRHPSFLLLSISPSEYGISKCYLPTEFTIVLSYIICLLLICSLVFKRRLIQCFTRTTRLLIS